MMDTYLTGNEDRISLTTMLRYLHEAGIYFLLFFTPFAFGSAHVWAESILELTVFLLLALLCLEVLFLGDGARRIPKLAPVYYCAFGFFLFVLFQLLPVPPSIIEFLSPATLELFKLGIPGYVDGEKMEMWRALSVNPFETLDALALFSACFGAFFLVVHEFRERKKVERLVIMLVSVGMLEAVYAFLEYSRGMNEIMGYAKKEHLDSVTGSFVNRNHFAGFLGMIIPLSIGYLLSLGEGISNLRLGSFKEKMYAFLATNQGKFGVFLGAGIILMMLGIFFSLSRMGLASMIVSLGFMGLVSLFGTRKGRSFFLLLSLALFALLVFTVRFAPLSERLLTIGDALVDRTELWTTTITMIKDAPIAGTGFGAFEEAFKRYHPEPHYKRILFSFNHAHNDYLELFADVGAVGGLLFLTGIGLLLLAILRERRKQESKFSRWVSLGVFGSVCYILLHSATDFNLHVPANALLFSVLLGTGYASATFKVRKRRRMGMGRAGEVIALTEALEAL